MIDLSDASRAMLEIAIDLTNRLHAKGYPKARAEIWIGRDDLARPFHIYINNPPREWGWTSYRSTLADAIRETIEAIDALPDPNAMAPWFTVAREPEAAE